MIQLPARLDRAVETLAFQRDATKASVLTEAITRYLASFPDGNGERSLRHITQNAAEFYIASLRHHATAGGAVCSGVTAPGYDVSNMA
jgi:hypothetical protein